MLAFLVLHVVGLTSVIVVSMVYGMWDLVLVNSLVFLALIRLETVLCAKRYTVPLPVYADGTVGAAQPEAREEVPQMKQEQPEPSVSATLGEEREPQLTPDFEVVAA